MKQSVIKEFPPVTGSRIKNHFHYDWWRYLLLVAGAVFVWNLLFTTTHYRAPADKKIEWIYEAPVSDPAAKAPEELLKEARETELPEMEEMNFILGGYDETYGQMQLMVWAAAGTGDLYSLSRERFKSMAEGGTFIDLQPYVDNGMLQTEGIDLARGYVRDSETHQRYLAGIPMDSLTALSSECGLPVEQYCFCISTTSGNKENSIRLMNWLIHTQK